MLLETLTDKVVKDVWSYPEADRQYVFKPTQLSNNLGRINDVIFPYYGHIRFPVINKRYMVYLVGQINPKRLGINVDLWAWAPMTSIVEDTGTIFQFFINNKQLNLDGMWITRTESRALLLLVEYDRNKKHFTQNHQAYFRVYTSGYYAQVDEQVDLPSYSGKVVQTTGDASGWLTQVLLHPEEQILPFAHGYLVGRNLSVSELPVGTDLHYWVDETLEGKFDTPLSSIRYYASSEYASNYYILQSPFTDKVHFLDDVEFYLFGHKEFIPGVTREVGLYIPRIALSSLLNLSHCDYALNVSYVDGIMNLAGNNVDFSNAFIRCYVRRNDEQKPIHGDGALLRHFYRLPADVRINFFTGTNSGIPFWQADALDHNPYNLAMRESQTAISARVNQGHVGIKDIFSYFGVLDILEKNHYDEDGNLLFSPMDKNGAVYLSFTSNGVLTSVNERNLGVQSNVILDQGGAPTDKHLSFAGVSATVADVIAYDPDDDYEDEYNTVRYYEAVAGVYTKAVEGSAFTVDPITKKVTWDGGLSGMNKYKRSARDIFVTEYQITRSDIGNVINIAVPDANTPGYVEFGFANVDIWVNNRHMARGIDYTIEYPYIRIRHLEYLPNNEDPFSLVVLRHGLPADAEAPYPDREIGWITNGEISRDGEFDFYLDAVPYIYIGGRYVETDSLVTAELGTGQMPAWVEDGMPYSIIPRVQHSSGTFMRAVTDGRTDAYSKLSVAEEAVGLILSESVPEVPININGQHELVSVLLNKLIRDLDSNVLIVENNMTDAQAGVIINDYMDYLTADLAASSLHEDFVVYYPTSSINTFSLNVIEYAFIEQVNRIYLDNRVQLNYGLTIS